MRWYRFLPLLPTIGALVFLTGALKGPARSVPPSHVGPSLADDLDDALPDPRALGALDEAIKALSPARVPWLETTIWQKVRFPGFEYEAHGRYLRGPERRFRLELTTHQGGTEGGVLLVSDGVRLWEARRAATRPWGPVACAPLTAPEGDTAGLPGPSFRGVLPLLRNLRKRLTWVRREALSTDEVRLSGVWSARARIDLVSAGQPWPEGLPRRCRLTLNARTSWPARIEWWGRASAGGPSVLLAEMELRRPQINVPLSPDCAARVFASPGKPAS